MNSPIASARRMMPDPAAGHGRNSLRPTSGPRLIYLHGFRSSPASFKARLLGEAIARSGGPTRFVCPQLADAPAEAWAMIRDQLAPCADDVVVGSSLGGFYARSIAEQTGCRAVLINPALDAPRLLARQIGVHQRWHGPGSFEFRAADVKTLEQIAARTLTRPERYLLIAATGDEVIDWHTMVAGLPGVQAIIIEGSDHALSDFEHHLPAVLRFAGIADTAGSTLPTPQQR